MTTGIPGLEAYPKTVMLRDQTEVEIRPLAKGDTIGLLNLFQRIPEEERYYLKENVASPAVIQDWTDDIDYQRVFPIVAIHEHQIIGDATLHRSRAPAHRHIGEIWVVVDPRYRNQGLGTMMLEGLIYIAYDSGRDRVFMQLVEEKESSAIRVAEMMEFDRVATLPGFAKDIAGNDRNLVVLELTLGTGATGSSSRLESVLGRSPQTQEAACHSRPALMSQIATRCF